MSPAWQLAKVAVQGQGKQEHGKGSPFRFETEFVLAIWPGSEEVPAGRIGMDVSMLAELKYGPCGLNFIVP